MTVVCKASCVIYSENGNNVLGHLSLTQSDLNQPTKITGTLSGLSVGKHGISVCQSGDLSKGATTCGTIYNPFGKTHGAPEDEQRMAGDIGNIVVEADGTANVEISDKMVQLLGAHSVIGRSIVIYAGEDDHGRGGHEQSLVNGNAGPRIGAGVIGLSA